MPQDKNWMSLSKLHALLGEVLEKSPKAKWNFEHGEGVYSLNFKLSRSVKLTDKEHAVWYKKGLSSYDEDETPEKPGEFFMLLDDTWEP